MQFTPGQLRSTIGLSAETYRHWRRVMPSFIGRKGYAPCFSVGDLIAAGVIHTLTECGVRIGALSAFAPEIVRLCNGTAWAALEGKHLVVAMPSGVCEITRQLRPSDGAILACSLDPVLVRVRDALTQSEPTDDQVLLRFPLMPVSRETRRRRRA